MKSYKKIFRCTLIWPRVHFLTFVHKLRKTCEFLVLVRNPLVFWAVFPVQNPSNTYNDLQKLNIFLRIKVYVFESPLPWWPSTKIWLEFLTHRVVRSSTCEATKTVKILKGSKGFLGLLAGFWKDFEKSAEMAPKLDLNDRHYQKRGTWVFCRTLGTWYDDSLSTF